MKKIMAFLMAGVLFMGTAYGVHIYRSNRLISYTNEFSTWTNASKFMSSDAMRTNLNKESLVVFGSSEFEHGLDTPYHPRTMFQNAKLNPMLIGAGYYQCLSHAITLSAIGKSIPNKKVVLLLSPTWFRKEGVNNKAFASRFSESSYLEMLKNKAISSDTKTYMEKRTIQLLEVDEPTRDRIKRYQRVISGGDTSIFDQLDYRIYAQFLMEKSQGKVLEQMEQEGVPSNGKPVVKDTPIEWEACMKQAEADGITNNQNPFYMNPKSFSKIELKMGKKRNCRSGIQDAYTRSPEYGDLRCFLDVCKEQDITPLLVALPVNGYWYDYTGFPSHARAKYYENIRSIAKEYDVQLEDLSDREFTKYFFEDGVHLGGKGWVTVDELLYNFYNKDKKQ
ncbi:MAG: D-alanyl-lipoteichoic acid biosynthesis protein DltD [Lachnospiraceae bacterium]